MVSKCGTALPTQSHLRSICLPIITALLSICARLTISVVLSEWNKNVVSLVYKQELNNLETGKVKEEFKESCWQYYLDHRHETLSDQMKGS